MTERVIAIGQSHVRALIDAGCRPSRRSSEVEFTFAVKRPQQFAHISVGSEGPLRRPVKGSVADLLRSWGASRVALAWGGNQMNTRALVATGPPFDMVLPGSPGADPSDPGTVIVPCSVVAGIVNDRLTHSEGLSEILVAAAELDLPICMLSPPPPAPEEVVRERMASEPHFVKVLEALEVDAAHAPLVPDVVRVKLWRVMCHSYRTFAEAHRMEFFEAPPEGLAPNGTLGLSFCGTDATHAGAAYGALVLDQLERWATGQDR